MNAIKQLINRQEFFPIIIVLLLSTLFIGYALSSVFLAIFFITSSCYLAINKNKVEFDVFLILPIALYCLFCLSYFWTVDLSNTIKGLGRMIAMLIIPLAFIAIPRFSKSQINFILKWFTIANACYGLFFLFVALYRFILEKDYSVFTYHKLVEVLDLNAIYVSALFFISIFYLLLKRFKTRLEKGIFTLLLIMLFLLSSKMIILVFILGAFIYSIKFKPLKKTGTLKSILILTIILSVVGISSIQVLDRFKIEKQTKLNEVLYNEKFNKVYPWTGTSFRLLQLRILKNQINEDGILFKGFGLFASRKNLKERHLDFNTYYGYHTYNYHNMYAQVLAEVGILGLLIIISMLLLSLIKSLKSKHFLFTMFCVLFLFLFFTESFLWVQRGLFYFLSLYCLFNRSIIIEPNHNKICAY